MLCDCLDEDGSRRISGGTIGPREQCEYCGFSRNRPLGMRAQRPSELHQAMNGMGTTHTIDTAYDDEPVCAALDEIQRRGQCRKRARTSVWEPRDIPRNE